MSKISASNMHNGNWMFTRQVGAEHPEGGTPCVIIGVRDYEAYEVVQLIDWLADRAAGYPKRNLPWHEIGCLHDGRPIPPPTIATRSG